MCCDRWKASGEPEFVTIVSSYFLDGSDQRVVADHLVAPVGDSQFQIPSGVMAARIIAKAVLVHRRRSSDQVLQVFSAGLGRVEVRHGRHGPPADLASWQWTLVSFSGAPWPTFAARMPIAASSAAILLI